MSHPIARSRTAVIAALVVAGTLALAAPAHAQRGRGHARSAPPRTTVIVRGGYVRPYYYRPYYRPYSYDPFFLYGDWYSFNRFGYPPYPYVAYDRGASLRLQVTPRDAEVYVDGYLAGSVDDFDGVFQRLDVRPGEHDLEFYKDGFRSVHQKVFLSAGKTFRVRYDMLPLRPGDAPDARPLARNAPEQRPGGYPPPEDRDRPMPRPRERDRDRDPDRVRGRVAAEASGFGAIAIRVQPDDAEIRIDGERWEKSTPGARLVVQTPVGRRHVEIRKGGLRTFTQDVDVEPGQTVTLNVSLHSEGE